MRLGVSPFSTLAYPWSLRTLSVNIKGVVTAIAGGVLNVSSGYSTFGYMPGNVLLAFSVDGQ